MEHVPETYDEEYLNFLCEHPEIHDLGKIILASTQSDPDIEEKVRRFYTMSLLPL